MTQQSGVFEIRNTVKNEAYMGCSQDAARAWNTYRKRLRSGTHNNMALQEAWERDGEQAFVFEMAESSHDRAHMRLRLKERIAAAATTTYNKNYWPRDGVRTAT